MLTEQQKRIILEHDASERPRARMEVLIVSRIIKDAIKRGFVISVGFSEEEEKFFDGSKKLLRDVFNNDVSYLLLKKENEEKWSKHARWIKIVLGKNGHDCISDYTVNVNDLLSGAKSLSKAFENGMI